MAQRRMFSQRITNSARFLKMSPSAQNLYFHLGMRADDDGIVEAFTIMQMLGSAEDDFKVLVAKGFVRPLNEDLVTFILDWGEHNLIRADRKVDSIYKDLLLQIVPEVELLKAKPRADTGKVSGRPLDDKWTAQVRLGKDRIGKDIHTTDSEESDDISFIIDLFKEVNPSYKKLFPNTSQRKSVERMLETHGKDKLQKMIVLLPKSNVMDYMPVITTPCQLEDKMGQLATAWQKYKNKEPLIL